MSGPISFRGTAMAGLEPISPALRAAAQLDRVLVQALDRLAYPDQPQTGFAPYVAPKPATPPPVATQGKNPMGAPALRNLSAVLRTAILDIVKEAETVAAEVTKEVVAIKQTVADARHFKQELRDAHAEVKATLGLGTNGAEDDTPHTGPLDVQSPVNSE